MSIEETQAVVTPLAEFAAMTSSREARSVPTGRSTSRTAWPVQCCIDGSTGDVSPYADGLPPKAFPDADIGGPVDVAFAGSTAYVLVSW